MRFSLAGAALMAAAAVSADQAASTSTPPVPACTALSSTSNGAFFDLRPDIAQKPAGKKATRSINKDYHARGYDYQKNFTLNICEPVVAPVKDVVGVSKSLWSNVSAYYTYKDKVYSIGYDLQSSASSPGFDFAFRRVVKTSLTIGFSPQLLLARPEEPRPQARAAIRKRIALRRGQDLYQEQP